MEKKKETFPTRGERVPYGGGKPVKPVKTGRERKERKTEKKTEPLRRRFSGGGKNRNRNAAWVICAALVLLVFVIFVRKNGSAVYLAEEQMGILEGTKITSEELVETLESQLQSIVGSEVQINEEIRVERVHIGRSNEKDVCTMEHLLPKLRNLVTYKVNAAVIMVDGGKTVVLANTEAAEAVLAQLQEDLLPSEGVAEDAEISWQEDVQIVSEFVDSDEILEQEDAIAVLEATTEVTQSYTVQSGDALYLIAQEFQTTVERILEVNPDAGLDAGIKVGQVINVPVQKPKLSVKSVETQVLTAIEPKTYETQYDDTKPASYQKVVQQGKAGQKKSTIQITRINGEVTEEKEVSKEIIQEAVPEIIVKGTQ